jgi:hypothetical protein
MKQQSPQERRASSTIFLVARGITIWALFAATSLECAWNDNAGFSAVTAQETCASSLVSSLSNTDISQGDPSLQTLRYTLSRLGSADVEEHTTLVYVQPDVATFYRDTEQKDRKLIRREDEGMVAKFINMSNKPVTLYW